MGSDDAAAIDDEGIRLAREVYEIASRHLVAAGCDPYARGPKFTAAEARAFARTTVLQTGVVATRTLFLLPSPWNVPGGGAFRPQPVPGTNTFGLIKIPLGCVRMDIDAIQTAAMWIYAEKVDPGTDDALIARLEAMCRDLMSMDLGQTTLTPAQISARQWIERRLATLQESAGVSRQLAGGDWSEEIAAALSRTTAGTRIGVWVADFGAAVEAAASLVDRDEAAAIQQLCGGKLTADAVFGVAMALERLCDNRKEEHATSQDGHGPMADVVDRPALNAKARFVLEVIAGVSPSAAIKGPQIILRAEASLTHEDLDKSELTGRIIPKLKEHYGVESTDVGYRLRPADRDWVLQLLDMA